MAFAGGYDWDEHNRQTALRGQQTLERTSQSIANSHAISIETEQIGTGVMSELNDQRESLLRSKNRLQNMDDGLSKSRRVIQRMKRHVLYNKILLIFIIILEVAILVALILIKYVIK